MAADFSYDGSKIVVCNGTSGTPKTFADMHDADLAGTLSLHTRDSIDVPDGAPVAVDHGLQPADQLVLGGTTGQDLYITVTNWSSLTSTTIQITGTAADGGAQTDDLVITGNGTTYAAKFFKTVTHTEVTVVVGAGDYDYELIQGRWGVVWEIAQDGQYKIDCDIDFGDGATSTYFQSENEMVYFEASTIFFITDNATLQSGILIGNYGHSGSSWSVGPSAHKNFLTGWAGTIKFYGSSLHMRTNYNLSFYGGSQTFISSVFNGTGQSSQLFVLAGEGSGLTVKRLTVTNAQAVYLGVTPNVLENLISHNCNWGVFFTSTVTAINLAITNATTDVATQGFITATIKDPINNILTVDNDNASGVIIEQYTCNIHVTDKDGADLSAVDVDCEYAHLVEGSDSKTYKCIQDHTSVDATHKPITGTNWDEYWELYDSSGGLGGPWQTTFDFKADTEEFSTAATDANGDIAEQTIDYKKWVGTSEVLEARIHKFTFSHASYPDMTIEDVIVSTTLVWRIDMGQSDSDLTALMEAAIIPSNTYLVGVGQPYATIGAAVIALEAAGDDGKIVVYPGTYDEAVVVGAGKRIHFESAIPKAARVTYSAADGTAFSLRSDCSLDGFYVTADGRAVVVNNGDTDVMTKNCYLEATGTGGVEDAIHALNVDSLIVDNCVMKSTFDCINNSGGRAIIRNSYLLTDGTSADDLNFSCLISGSSGKRAVIIENCVFEAGMPQVMTEASPGDLYGIKVSGPCIILNSDINAFTDKRYNTVPEEVATGDTYGIYSGTNPVILSNTNITTTNASGLSYTIYDLYTASGSFVISGVAYDKTKTSGTIEQLSGEFDDDIATIENILEADWSIDKTPTPWQIVAKKKGTADELIRKDLKDVDGNNVTAVTSVIGRHTEPA